MPRLPLILSGLLSVVLAAFVLAVPAVADDPPAPTARVVVSQRVELLPQGPLCWTVFRVAMEPGGRFPASDYAAGPLMATYSAGGAQRFEFSGGPSRQVGRGEGVFIGADNWFAHMNTGSVSAESVVYALSCGGFPPQAPGVTVLGRTPPLPNIKAGSPYMVTLSEYQRGPGERGPVRLNPYAAGLLMLEGSLALSTPTGAAVYHPGDLFVAPADVPFRVGVPGAVRARYLVLELQALGETGVLDPPGVAVLDPLATAPTASAAAPAAQPPASARASPSAAFGGKPLIRTMFLMPVRDNNGAPFSKQDWQELERRLALKVGGFTVHTGVRGAYADDGKIYPDESREYIASISSWTALGDWLEVLRWAKGRFGQNFLYVEVAGVPELL